MGRVLLGLTCCLIVEAASAQIQATARLSEITYNYVCGYGPDTYLGSDAESDPNLLGSDSIGLAGTATHSDEYLGNGWTATFDWDAAHEYSVDGGLSSAYRITSAGFTTTDSVITGFATGTVSSASPGNRLELEFTLSSAHNFWFRGSLEQVGPTNRNNANLYIYRWVEPTGYQVYTGRVLQNSSWDDDLALPAGAYRIVAQAVSHASQLESANAGWSYELRAKPLASCPADLDLSGNIDAQDLSFLLAAYAQNDTGDTDNDGDTDAQDLANLLAVFNTDCP